MSQPITDRHCLNIIGDIVKILIQEGFSVTLTHRKHINGMYAGSFSSHKKEFKVAMGDGMNSMAAFMHEYCHYRQWKSWKPGRWDDISVNGLDVYFDWAAGGKCGYRALNKAVSKVLELEHDCEVRAMEFIRCYSLPIKLPEYARRANAYLMLYACKMRGVLDDKHISIAEVADSMPDQLMELSQFNNAACIKEFKGRVKKMQKR